MGLAAGATAIVASVLPEAIAGIAPELTGALIGGGLGALESGITGGNPLTGALVGGITGGFIPAGGALGADLGVGSTAGELIGGAAGGALGAGVTGGNPLTGAAEGAAAGGISSFLGSSNTPGSTGAAAPSAGASAASTAIPSGVANAPTDLTTLAPTSAAATDVGTGTITGGGGGIGILTGQGGDFASSVLGAPTTPLATQSQAANFAATGATPSAGGGGSNFSLTNPSTWLGGGSSSAPSPSTFSATQGGAAPSTGIIGSLENAVSKNPIGAVAAGGGLLYNLVQGNATVKGESQLQNQANALTAQSNQLTSYLNSGTLPPTLQSALTTATNSAKASVRSQFAAAGLSGSSAEADALNQVEINAVNTTGQIGEQLLNSGLTEAQISGELLNNIVGINQKQAASTGSSIASLAAALAGGRAGVGGAA